MYFEDFAVPGETPKLSDQLMYKTDAEPRWSVGHFVLWSVAAGADYKRSAFDSRPAAQWTVTVTRFPRALLIRIS